MSNFLQGIPISDEQCIGDSLETINNAFLKLSSSTVTLSGNLALTGVNLSTLWVWVRNLSSNVLDLSGQVVVLNGPTNVFTIEPRHNNSLVLINTTASTTTIRPSAGLTYKPGHSTRFIQLNSEVVNLSGINSVYNQTELEGQFSFAEITYTSASTINRWIATGDLRTIPETLYSLTALPPEEYQELQGLSIVEAAGFTDIIYFYKDLEISEIPIINDIYVNDVYRTTVTTTEDRIGTIFGYRLEEFPGDGPQLSGVFVAPGEDLVGRVYLTTSQPLNTLYNSLSANYNEDPGAEGNLDERNYIYHEAVIEDGEGDVIFYSDDPNAVQQGTPKLMDIKVNGVHRTTVSFSDDRLGTTFGYKRSGVIGGAEAKGLFVEGEINFVLTPIIRPTPTPTNTPTNTRPTNTPTRTPTNTPTPSPFALYKIVADGEDPIHYISFTKDNPLYSDTISYYGLNLEDIVLGEPMYIYVNGTLRTVVSFPDDFYGKQFGYQLANSGTTNPQVYGTFSPGRVDLTISSFFNTPTPTPTPTSTPRIKTMLKAQIDTAEDLDNQISFTSVNDGMSAFKADIIEYDRVDLTDFQPYASEIKLNGVYRTVLNFPDDRFLNTPFTNRTFAHTLTASLTGQQSNGLKFAGSTGIKDILYFGSDLNISETPLVNDVYVDGNYRSTITTTDDRVGTVFGYRMQEFPGTGAQLSAVFVPAPNGSAGRVDIQTSSLVYKMAGVLTFHQGGSAALFWHSLSTNNGEFDLSATNLIIPPLSSLSATVTSSSSIPQSFAHSLTSSEQGEELQGLNIISETGRRDTIFFASDPNISELPIINDIYVNNAYRATVTTTEDRIGTIFGYRLEEAPGTGAQLSAVFVDPGLNPVGKVDIQATTSDSISQIKITSTNSSYNGDKIYYYSSRLKSHIEAPTMEVYVNNVHRASVGFPVERLGTPFGYSITGNQPQISSNFKAGRVDLYIP